MYQIPLQVSMLQSSYIKVVPFSPTLHQGTPFGGSSIVQAECSTPCTSHLNKFIVKQLGLGCGTGNGNGDWDWEIGLGMGNGSRNSE